MAATTISRTRTRFRPHKIRLHCRLFLQAIPLQQLKENNFKVYITNSHLLAFKFFPVFNLDAQHNEMTQGKNKDVLLKQEVDFLVTA